MAGMARKGPRVRNEGKADWVFSAQAHAKRPGRANSIIHHHSMPDSFWFMKRAQVVMCDFCQRQ
ncbi:hypothetical protein N7516_002271 [Penicillium verrucosum]|uniref:uncharacterized protein n=1 Tax=Penicillium verrucosum TaxID=60171 RepID=UPI0025456874|nr:uncharacterized protein N7516_002271 [Penicillium verrucosum]KAJ5942103.1 hypothetical protein N7516_002271 [Penicillium verrucosum]